MSQLLRYHPRDYSSHYYSNNIHSGISLTPQTYTQFENAFILLPFRKGCNALLTVYY